MTGCLLGPMISRRVHVEAAARFDGDLAPVRAVAGQYLIAENGVWIRVKCGDLHPLPRGNWVIRYGPDDIGVFSDGALRRYFPAVAAMPPLAAALLTDAHEEDTTVSQGYTGVDVDDPVRLYLDDYPAF